MIASLTTQARRLQSATAQGRHVSRLYDNGTFELQLVDPSSGKILVYSGRYAEVSGVVNLDWDDSSTAGPWGATGTVDGTSLTVQYNLIMQLTGFENALYRLVP